MVDSENVFAKIDRHLTKEVIDAALNGEQANKWQQVSYPVIINYFANAAGKHSKKSWVKRIAFTYSWLQSIPRHAKPNEIDKNFIELEKDFQHVKLKKIKFIETENDKIIGFKKKQHSLNEFLLPISALIFDKENLDTQLPALVKLLHFMFPELFPMFDRNASNRIFGSSFQSISRYYSYMEGLKTYLNDGTNAAYLVKKAKERSLSPLYLIELAICTDSQTSETD
ncbi:hypothetical protein [Oceanobacillus massiliensis]|uniref:hypothetical protein n=1 Tax=Oceanobacillus massiliensis TaxID=1465765 RepID=UPI000287E59F|nr:hypothetical protein [Oceanobacillus massiliensis]